MKIQKGMVKTTVKNQTSAEKIERLDNFILSGLFIFAIFSCIARIGALAALVITTILIVIRHRQSPYRQSIPGGVIGMYIIFICSLIPSLAFSQNLQKDVRPFLNIVFDILPLLLVWFGIRGQKQIIPLIAALAFSLALSSLAIIYYGLANGLNPNLRFISFGYFCMITAGFLGVLLPLLGVFILEQRELNRWLKAGLIAATFIGIGALAINMNRGVWISMIAVTFVYMMVKLRQISRWAIAALFLLAIIGLGVTMIPQFRVRAESIRNDSVALARSYQLIFHDDPTAEFKEMIKNAEKDIPERIYMWNGAWCIFREHPLSGVGLGSVEDVFKSGRGYISPLAAFPPSFKHAHNNFLQFLAATGIPGFLGFTGLFACVLWTSIRRYSRNSKDWWSLIGILVTISFLLQGLTEYNYVHAVLARLYWFVLGISMVASQLNSDNAGKREAHFE